MRWGNRVAVLLVLLAATWLGNVAELGVAIPPPGDVPDFSVAHGTWFPKSQFGLNHVILRGNAFERGLAYGSFTKDLLFKQEQSLVDKVQEIFPSKILQLAFLLFAKRWFWGEDQLLDDDWKREMHGVSFSAPARFDYLADPYTRQLAYHGIHEVGQMFVDFGGEGMACTVLAVKQPGKGWLIGRNLDFEGGRIFDEEKIVKWVFPEKGIPFVSVIWAGMVGAVTGVNAKGVYLSINAAGSSEFARFGTPSTLLLLKALQFANTAEEAVEIFKSGKTIITESFVVSGPGSPLFVIEKSPKRTVVRVSLHDPVAVANHLLSPEWAGDKVNEFRRAELTSSSRLARGTAIVKDLALRAGKSPDLFRQRGGEWIAEGLRDKLVDGRELVGNRAAIDALIATHAVVYDMEKGVFFISTGPSLAGKFLGFDLGKSFSEGKPVPAGELSADTVVLPEQYAGLKADIAAYERVSQSGAKKTSCSALEEIRARKTEHYAKYMALGFLEERCGSSGERILADWKKAMELKPAYAREFRSAQEHARKAGI